MFIYRCICGHPRILQKTLLSTSELIQLTNIAAPPLICSDFYLLAAPWCPPARCAGAVRAGVWTFYGAAWAPSVKGEINGLLNQSNELRDEAVAVVEALAGADLEEAENTWVNRPTATGFKADPLSFHALVRSTQSSRCHTWEGVGRLLPPSCQWGHLRGRLLHQPAALSQRWLPHRAVRVHRER